jgi:membrane protease YdiL (CAAX protease family)
VNFLRRITIDAWRKDVPAGGHLLGEPANLQALVILTVTAVVLTVQWYYGDRDTYERWFPYPGPGVDHWWELKGFAWWAGWRIGGYVLIPIITIALMPGQRIRDYHLSPKGFFRHLLIYVGLFLFVLPAVIVASRTPQFRETYPFYRQANQSYKDLFLWEAIYAAQFTALEFFFRGFLLQGLRKSLGGNAVFVMIVPYCMIHYGKPMSETLGAIIAGLVLGSLAMRTRSIWGGVMIHVTVGITMDLLALGACPPMGSITPCSGN